MNCSDFQNQVVDYLNPATSFGDFSEIIPHIKECISCRREWQRLRGVQAAFAAQTVKEPHPHSIYALIQEAARHTESKKAAFTWSRFFDRVFTWNLAPMMVGLFLAVSVLSVLASIRQPHVELASDATINPASSIPVRAFQARELIDENMGAVRPVEVGMASAPFGLRSVVLEDFNEFNNPTALPAPITRPVDEDMAALSRQFQGRQQALLESDADTLFMQGRRFKTLGRMDLAVRDFETIYHFYPNYTYMGDVLMYRAQCYAFLGNVDKAIESLEVFSKKYPSKQALVTPMIDQLKKSNSPSNP